MKTPINKNYAKYLSTPLKTGIQGFNDLANYYLYCAPNIDCIHSKVKFEQEKAEKIFFELVNMANMRKQYKVYERKRGNYLQEYCLDGNSINLQEAKMVIKKKNKKEDNLSALLRHIRNSFAHGLIYVCKNKQTSYIVLEDKFGDEINSKIVLTTAILFAWKETLELATKNNLGKN